jgi:hypothetical protein
MESQMSYLQLDPISFAGVLDLTASSKATGNLDEDDMLDDLAGEEETMPTTQDSGACSDGDITELLSTVKDVSRGVSDGTHDEYCR